MLSRAADGAEPDEVQVGPVLTTLPIAPIAGDAGEESAYGWGRTAAPGCRDRYRWVIGDMRCLRGRRRAQPET